jgi:hypothetical protein
MCTTLTRAIGTPQKTPLQAPCELHRKLLSSSSLQDVIKGHWFWSNKQSKLCKKVVENGPIECTSTLTRYWLTSFMSPPVISHSWNMLRIYAKVDTYGWTGTYYTGDRSTFVPLRQWHKVTLDVILPLKNWTTKSVEKTHCCSATDGLGSTGASSGAWHALPYYSVWTTARIISFRDRTFAGMNGIWRHLRWGAIPSTTQWKMIFNGGRSDNIR